MLTIETPKTPTMPLTEKECDGSCGGHQENLGTGCLAGRDDNTCRELTYVFADRVLCNLQHTRFMPLTEAILNDVEVVAKAVNEAVAASPNINKDFVAALADDWWWYEAQHIDTWNMGEGIPSVFG